ncbi:PD-(D/E)XK nuclease family protein [Natrialbaceae archaeon A-chndr2]
MSEADVGERIDQANDGELLESISMDRFREWFRERQFRRNIEEGKPYFNGPSTVPPPRRHSPSQLLQCHRKITYRQCNAPSETKDPDGIFWIGSWFEEDLALSFLKDAVVGDDEYVTNSLWVDFTVQTDAGELQIKGSTDPVIVDSDANPLLLTEIKTKQSVESVESPNVHHRAQAHAYMKGLSEKYDRNVAEAVILYGSRETLDIKAFHVDFDPWFWRSTALDWAATHTTYRLNEELPPADPEFDWECRFCSYRERCGRGDTTYDDLGPGGFLPLHEYPREKVRTYLEAHDNAKITPTLAHCYPRLADTYEVHDWRCTRCSETYSFGSVTWDGEIQNPPQCKSCCETGIPATLAGDSIAAKNSGGV